MQNVTASNPAATGNDRPRNVGYEKGPIQQCWAKRNRTTVLTELVEKKSMSFPMVRGTNIDTEEDTSNYPFSSTILPSLLNILSRQTEIVRVLTKPTAIPSCLDSGVARSTSFPTLDEPDSVDEEVVFSSTGVRERADVSRDRRVEGADWDEVGGEAGEEGKDKAEVGCAAAVAVELEVEDEAEVEGWDEVDGGVGEDDENAVERDVD